MRLDGKRVLVTGATGIAGAAAQMMVDHGASVFVISLHEDECEALADQVNLAGWEAADLTEHHAATAAVERATSDLGALDGLFAVAGGSGRRFGDGPLHQIPVDAWQATLDLNLTTSFLVAREVVAGMVRSGDGGSVVITSSVLATQPVAGLFSTHAYAAAKGAQISMATAMAAEYAGAGIRVNVVAPGLVRTPMSERAAADPAIVDFARAKQPLADGFLDPRPVASAACFLLSDDAAMITGQVLGVDGGWSVSDGRV